MTRNKTKKISRKPAAHRILRTKKPGTVRSGSIVAPFVLKDQKNVPHLIDKEQSEYTVLFFYPKDNTPGCTIEARGFSNELDHFHRLNTRVFGISGGSEKSKASFCAKYGLRTIMLADADLSISKRFGAYGEKSFMGKKTLGIRRMTFILDRKMKVVRVFNEIDTKFHPAEVLLYIAAQDKPLRKSGSVKTARTRR